MVDKYEVCYLGVGSNLGERLSYLRLACALINSVSRLKIQNYSSIYETLPVGYLKQPEFYNAVIKIKTDFSPCELLDFIKRAEQFLGRSAYGRRWGPRVIDIDILQYGKRIVKSKRLLIPHPALYERYFWITAIAEIEKNGIDFRSGDKWSRLKGYAVSGRSGCRKIFNRKTRWAE